ncbi:polysaccharide lyase family 8 super-sandwich domain-containing protein [Compostibacter hankyongensis]|uniref:Polysaccharide lyase 8 family protein n=1 Tax=Compostibacter hankyongensis TaxID=1007089 RepID=A0ABP8FNG1_9BACT
MKKACFLPFFILLLCCGRCFAQYTPDTVLNRYRSYLFRTFPAAHVRSWIATLDAGGQWPDINYADKEPAKWKVSGHLQRVRSLALAWARPGTPDYHREAIWKTISAALDHWLKVRYKSVNWWHNQIGVPQFMRDIIILTREKLTPEQRKGALAVLAQLKVDGVGANLVWSADLGLHYAALTGDSLQMQHCSTLISREIKITRGEGIQPDYSFHQHGPRLQMYQYGAAFLDVNVRLAWELRGTPWAFPEDKVNILTRFLLNGWQWMARGIHTVPGTMDRSASRINALNDADVRNLVPFLSELRPGSAPAFRAIAERQNGAGQPLTGFRYFPYSDFAAYHRKNFTFFLKTISDRTLSTESINHENLKGHLLNSGDAYLIRSGREYYNLMPVWNWERLPGVTSFDGADRIGRRPFTGSAGDGSSGLTVMDYCMSGKDGQQLTARKYWACHGDVVVCLIAGIHTANISGDIFTTLDQCRLEGKVTVNRPGNVLQQGSRQLEDVRWMYHNGFAYIPLKPAEIKLQTGPVTGSWSSINVSQTAAPVTEDVFCPVMVQPVQPEDASSGYALCYCPGPQQAAALAGKPSWTVLRNDGRGQAVSFSDGTLMAAFFSPGMLKLADGRRVTADRPCLLLITGETLCASDPAHTGGALHVDINGRQAAGELPEDGSTVKLSFGK